MDNFDRQYRAVIGQRGSAGVELGGAVGESGMPLHISFDIEKGNKESGNTATVKFWNLSPETIAEIKQKNAVLELCAGYGGNLPLILSGDISTSETVPDGADRVTTIEVVDGLAAVRDSYMSVSYEKGITGIMVLQGAADSMGLSTVVSAEASELLTQKILTNGYSFVGQSKNSLQKICDTCGCAWSIQNGILQVVKKGEAVSPNVYVLNAQSGLLDIPKELTENGAESEGGAKKGYEARYFLNGAIGVDDLVMLESGAVSGIFKVESVSMSGDNFEGEWTCTAKLVEPGGTE